MVTRGKVFMTDTKLLAALNVLRLTSTTTLRNQRTCLYAGS